MAIALFGFLVWGHHMFTSESELAALVFSVLTYLTAIPSGVKIFNWLATLYKGRISFEAPMLYAIIFLLLFAIGGLTGIFLGALSVDIMLHDTYFVVAHFHYVMMGGTVIAFIGGLHYWWPKIWGRMYSEKWARVSAALMFFGFNLTFIPQFIMGSQGMPRRYWQYDNMADTELFQFYHILSTVGSWMIGLAFIIMLVYLVHSIKNGKIAGSNPWGALTLEWQTPSPTPAHNFLEEPKIEHGPYAYDKVEAERTID
jgi:cytochrome c oxidase subunit 1